MKLTPWMVLFCLSLAACSGSKSAQPVDEEVPSVELSDADQIVDPSAEVAEEGLAVDADAPVSDAPAEETPVDSVIAESPVTDAPTDVVEEEPVAASSEPSPSPVVEATPSVETESEAGAIKQYTVQKNETLMIIAFKLYGDYEKWKTLSSQNQGKLNGSTNLTAGMVLNYSAPAQEFNWNPQGLAYLIRTGDTLAGISNTVYTTPKKWKLIWDNNRPLIKDPNRIFAGFTIYYLENGREVAAEL
ncbi:MAG TPA: LysM peptidoglycan-binding domain-containing protein [Bacteriovoracaceae bacterium]|nr:LysM peptidoglycan-binding domain-containing protein [Bacteriovoracaceae bacterium]